MVHSRLFGAYVPGLLSDELQVLEDANVDLIVLARYGQCTAVHRSAFDSALFCRTVALVLTLPALSWASLLQSESNREVTHGV